MNYEIAKSKVSEAIATINSQLIIFEKHPKGTAGRAVELVEFKTKSFDRAKLLINNIYRDHPRELKKFLDDINKLEDQVGSTAISSCDQLTNILDTVESDIIDKEDFDKADKEQKEVNDALRKAAAKYQNDFLELQKSTNGLNAKIEILTEERDEARHFQTKYSNEIETLNETIEQFRRGSVAKSDELHAALKEVEKQKQLIEGMQSQMKEIVSERNELKQIVAVKDTTIQGLLEKLNTQVPALLQDKNNLKDELEQLRGKAINGSAERIETVLELKGDLAKLEKEYNKALTEFKNQLRLEESKRQQLKGLMIIIMTAVSIYFAIRFPSVVGYEISWNRMTIPIIGIIILGIVSYFKKISSKWLWFIGIIVTLVLAYLVTAA